MTPPKLTRKQLIEAAHQRQRELEAKKSRSEDSDDGLLLGLAAASIIADSINDSISDVTFSSDSFSGGGGDFGGGGASGEF